ncbi:hypothetical protein EWH08_05805 [Sphingobium indicum]|uniref:Uncharacterized protein n=2 Tax=Sphingobium indicum TaxID=332055 RepID=A0A1L5BNA3_SPHIB|nr:hypothetical protein [Sphingobium indicum]APL94252.1 hypothetical protein SIDU_06875 [Sphingobium indicum B90A]KEY97569.1 hypothetical protein AI27_17795 [Sphingomonas sp. BHC-A]NYI21199.1 putative lipid-binding transport protein (Tim44 family) [Sphingobium indicum]RYM03995.1 hypothetical protein EWH08_05805 [Sphingobium indicum]
MFKTLLGGLIGGVAMYLVGFIFWGTPLSALAFNRAESAAGSNLQAALAQALTPSGTGVYVIPDPATAQGTILYGKGPVATVFYNNSGFPVTDAGALIGGLILALVVGIVIALMLRLASGDLGGRARATVLFALAAVLWLHVGQAVFNHAPWGYILYLAFSDFAALVAAGLVAAKIMESRQAAGSDATGEATLH